MGDEDALKFTILLLPLLIWVVCTRTNASQDFEQCENAVKGWASSSLPLHVKDDEHILLKHFLFFLHVPRTGGRTFLFCFLKKLYKSFECAHSYDKLRFDPSKPNCRLLASHDDYSMMTKLPKAETSVVTIVRNPIDRIFSSYEFSVEVASRYMVHPNLASVTRMARSKGSNTMQTRTLDIWPWKYLVPWMREDLFARRESRKNKVSTNIKGNDSYNMKDVLMPLLDYIRHPLALDLIHNGATFQIAGLTNNSNLEESHKVRHCVLKYLILGEYVLEVAKKRLDNMLYVGLTEKHKESATMFADVVGLQVISQLMAASNSSTNVVANNGSAQSISTFSNSESEPSLHSNCTLNQMVNRMSFTGKVEATKENPIVKELTKVYETCASDAHESQTRGHNVSLDNISVDFTKEGRSHVPDLVLQEIASFNSLDLQLYKHAQDIFAKQRRHVLQKVVGSETKENKLRYLLDVVTWKFILLTSIALLLFCVVLVVKARRRRSKLKE